jgi:FMN phosphatase YigB (HAD superfamily)
MKIIIFDLDGTLYSRESQLYRLMSTSIRGWFREQLKNEVIVFDEYFQKLKDLYSNPLEAIRELGLSGDSFQKNVFDKIDPGLYLSSDATLQEVLDVLPFKKYIVTFGSRNYALRALESLGVESYFSGIKTFDGRENIVSKLDLYESIRLREGIEPQEICIVGDDIRADLLQAYYAGYRCISVFEHYESVGIEHIESIHCLKTLLWD